jgi:hypothetical protein
MQRQEKKSKKGAPPAGQWWTQTTVNEANMRLRYFLILLFVVSVNSRCAWAQSQKETTKFEVAISMARQTIKLGSKINVDISLTNKSGRTIKVFSAGDDSVAQPGTYVITVKDESGEMPPRTSVGHQVIDLGIIVFRAHVAPNREVKDGESFKQKLELTDFFEFRPGKYTVQLDMKWGDSDKWPKSNVLEFTVTQ